eukprot:Phypoly_transcript_17625.p1 GENE.Phypoly_transcript_17625~~Phypoly_transcript_17625.p1  ORF type:complete len:165 (+),score=29.89 Phypoly_transcript_17625:297-791(+)
MDAPKPSRAEARKKAEQRKDVVEKLFEEPDYILDREEKVVADWMDMMLQTELKRIREAGSNAIPVPVKNVGIIREDNKVINRIEANTAFDFDKIQQLMVSDPTPCPHKADFSYANVLLFTDKPVPIIFPYMYSTATPNKLKSWLFVNNSLQQSRHQVKKFRGVE